MLFNSIDFLVFFPTVTLVFFLIPRKLRSLYLLFASYYFYACWNPRYTLLIALSTIITYISGLLIEKSNKKVKKKFIMALSLISNLLILAIFKYANFAIETLNAIFSHWGISIIDKRVDLLLPVGISFYTFQALSYTLDIYNERIEVERNLIRYALFVSFFPQLVAGPIERSGNLLRQVQSIKEKNLWDFERLRDGILLMFWGLFQKLVIADRASILVNQVYNNYYDYGFIELFAASLLFAVQIYCDFGGYTNIARGAAKVMGFSLMQNFKQPYFSTSIKEFWRRWHISLTSWFTDYLYIPLGGNRKGTFRKYINIWIVFGVSGLWHGASWHFVVWGMLHAAYQTIGELKNKAFQRFFHNKWDLDSFSGKLVKICVTFALVDIAWVFFASNSVSHAIGIFQQMFKVFQTSSLMGIGLDSGNWAVLIMGIVILFVVDLMHEKGKGIFEIMERQMLWYRWGLYLGLIWGTIMLGVYGITYDTSQFIYFQF